MKRTAAVVIGRNEADKLARALQSVVAVATPIVYVDSGSSDGSSGMARAMGVEVIDLDASRPFSVARGRNEGFRRALALHPDTEYVQFVDADSEIHPAWFDVAWTSLEGDTRIAAVFGRIRERDPKRSIFNRLYQAGFDAHFSEGDACPGMSMMRVTALAEANGFVEALRGFEDTELSFRFRQAGWRVVCVNADMAIHDARMGTFGQWWTRQVRSGFALGQERAQHAGSNVPYRNRETRSVWILGMLLPAFTLAAALPSRGWSLLLLGAYPVMALRIRRRYLRANPAFTSPVLYAASLLAGKIPEAIGLARFGWSRLGRNRSEGRLV